MKSRLKILHLEDSPNDAELVRSTLEADGIACGVVRVETASDFVSALDREMFDMIISDYSLPSFDGLSALRVAHEKCPEVPFLFVSGTIGEDVAIESLKMGATDYLLKQRMARLPSAVRRALHEAEEHAERKRAEARIQESQAWLNAIFDASRDGIVAQQNESIVYVNRAYAGMYGYDTPEDLIGKHVSTVQSAEDNERMLEYGRKRLAGEPTPSQYEFKGKRKDGRTIDVEASVSTAMIADMKYIISVVRDISDRKKLEAQLRQTQKLESIGTLAGGIAHDFNNILGIIIAYGSLLQRGKTNPDDLKEYTDTMMKAAERGAGLVKQILMFARKGDVSVEYVQVNEMIKELISMLHQTFPKTIRLSVDLDKSLPMISIDSGQLNQVLMNLCVNARDAIMDANKAGKKQSTISIRTTKVTGEVLRMRFSTASSEQYVSVSVSDTGVGMDGNTKERIFEPFFTTKEPGKGTGLGLAVVYGIVRDHQGIIDLESEIGKGTTFTLYFPVPKDVSAGAASVKKEVAEMSGGSETVLVIEDEEALRMLLKNLLEAKGYTVIAASDGLEGVALFEKHRDQIAAVVSDHGLPGMNGADAVRKMIAAKPGLKCIIASGYMEPKQKSEIYKSGIKEFIQKPYDPLEVVRKVREVLDLK